MPTIAHRPRRSGLALAVVVALVLAACGSSDDSSSEATTTTAGETTTTGETSTSATAASSTFAVPGTAQTDCYDDSTQIDCPAAGEAFYGQNGNFPGDGPRYTDNGDGTVTDDVTGLMWQQDHGDKTTYDEAVAGADSFELAGYDDWRLPTIKELYSLIVFTGVDPSTYSGDDTSGLTPFIDTDYFSFEYGVTSGGTRIIDSQWTTSTVYESTVFDGQECFFGVNFADGRIKCYPTTALGGNGGYFTRYVRGGDGYGENDFTDGGDGTVTDAATGLTWQQADSGEGMDWEAALDHCDGLDLGGHDDWRLPDTKELESIVDYSKSPDTTDSAAIDDLFDTTSITNEAGETDWPAFWSSTTHIEYPDGATEAAYVTFGRGMGYMNGHWIDVHGAGAQRSDPKAGDPSRFPTGRGPQGDAIRIDNDVRCVRGGVDAGANPNV
jgi:hypothetical protein